MKRMLIKTVLILLVVYVSGYFSNQYATYVSSTYNFNLAIDLSFRIIPGFLCGLIIGYETILQCIINKVCKFDIRYILVASLLVVLVLYPYLIYVLPITKHAYELQIDKILMSYTFGTMASFLAGYNLTQAFAKQK
jgi:hypothetical protein